MPVAETPPGSPMLVAGDTYPNSPATPTAATVASPVGAGASWQAYIKFHHCVRLQRGHYVT